MKLTPQQQRDHVRAETNEETLHARTYAAAVRRARNEYRVVLDDGIWWILYGKHRYYCYSEGEARFNYEKRVMLLALRLLDPKHLWGGYDWEQLTGSAERQMAAMLAWRIERDETDAVTTQAITPDTKPLETTS